MADAIYVTSIDSQYFQIDYEDMGNPAKRAQLEAQWKRFNRYDPATGKTFYLWYRPSSPLLEVTVDYKMPADAPLGLYRVEVFIPGRHATTRKAIFTIANNFRLVNNQEKYDDTVAIVDMYHLFDQWHSLGQFLLDPQNEPRSGRVRQYGISLEDPAVEISFGAIRWVPLFTAGGVPGPGEEETVPVASDKPRFDAPVGTGPERNGPFVINVVIPGLGPLWLGNWYDATPYLSWYFNGYHTGADLNLTTSPAADRDAPLYAVSEGKVIYAGAAGNWGNIIVIEHPDALATLPDGVTRRQMVFSRYGHVNDQIPVKVNDQVTRGQLVGSIGLARNVTSGWHLHFDIAFNPNFRNWPSHWPDMRRIRELQAQGKTSGSDYSSAQMEIKKQALAYYIDPFKFLRDNHG